MGAHHGHSHGVSAQADRRMLAVALGLNLGFFCVEVAIGLIAGSLALLSDAAHMLGDSAAIALALIAARLAAREASGAMTFGLKRGEILSAQANGLTLLLLAILIIIEAAGRLTDPPEVEASLVLWTGAAGIGVNLLAAWALSRANRANLGVEGAFQHTLLDGVASLGAVVAAVLILTTGFQRADPIASLIVAALMVVSAWGLLRSSGRILLEGAPAGTDPDQVGRSVLEVPGVLEVHDLHVWEVTSGFPALSAHVVVRPDADCHVARLEVAELLERRFGITHSTLQVEHRPEALLEIEGGGAAGPSGP